MLERDEWANFLIDNRALSNWSDYGTAVALLEVDKAWRYFLWYRDARELSLVPKTIKASAEEQADNMLGRGLSPSGEEYWARSRQDPSILEISSKQKNAWITGYVEAYRERLDDLVSDLAPKSVLDHLPIFCRIVSRVSGDVIQGDAAEDAWGFRLGGVRDAIKTHPLKAEILKRAKAEGKQTADLHWSWAVKDDGSFSSLYESTPYDWALTPDEEETYKALLIKAYDARVGEHIASMFPDAPWERAFLICSLYDEMEAQRLSGRKQHSISEGWSDLRSRRRKDEHEMRRQIEEEVEARHATPGARPSRPGAGS